MKIFHRISHGMVHFEDWTMIIGMTIASTLITLQVILRYVFNYSITWGEELTRYSIIWMSFVGAGMGIRKGAHISVDILLVLFTDRWKKILTLVMAIMGAAFGVAVLYTGIIFVSRSFLTGQISPAMEAPVFVVYLCVPIGGFIMTFRWAEIFVHTIKGFFPQVEVERKGGM
jgi:C4-dicarboxylate transporter DctQ subunit